MEKSRKDAYEGNDWRRLAQTTRFVVTWGFGVRAPLWPGQ